MGLILWARGSTDDDSDGGEDEDDPAVQSELYSDDADKIYVFYLFIMFSDAYILLLNCIHLNMYGGLYLAIKI